MEGNWEDAPRSLTENIHELEADDSWLTFKLSQMR